MPSLLDQIPDDVRFLLRRLREQGKRGWIVGGCVRDLLRDQVPKDWDVATDARPGEMKGMFARVVETGIRHGTVTVLVDGRPYEVTTLRGEGAYSDGRRPDEVHFVDDIRQDLARRDFTCNAIAIDSDGNLIDPFGGRQDLAAGIVRAVGEPIERFAEDGLRVLRAARFAAVLGARIDPATEQAMGDARAHATFRKVSAERIREEWWKSMRARRPSVAFEAMLRTGILALIAPELVESVGCAQNRFHAYDVWGHAMACLDACEPEPLLRLAALLHDVGKPRTRELSAKTGDYTFYDHEAVGAQMADPLLERLRFGNDERARIVALVRHHLICYASDWTDSAVRRWLRRVGPEQLPDLLRLARADARGKGLPPDEDLARLDELEARAGRLVAAGAALSVRDLAIGGRELIDELGMQPGPAMGRVLAQLLEQVLDDPGRNERAVLLAAARAIVAGR
ncbi:MAG: HD domain-containing protein [Planctomycetes bacterium]|nr:HD domain-containing protein [Planctomycetota bacterium]